MSGAGFTLLEGIGGVIVFVAGFFLVRRLLTRDRPPEE
jgi:hypothetical protein